VTILPAGMALGVTEQLPLAERHLLSESYLTDSLAVRLGGRAAELIVLGEASTGAASDLSGATALATRMIVEYGLSPDLGPVGYSSGNPLGRLIDQLLEHETIDGEAVTQALTHAPTGAAVRGTDGDDPSTRPSPRESGHSKRQSSLSSPVEPDGRGAPPTHPRNT